MRKRESGRLLHLQEADARPAPKTLDRENGRIIALLNEKERQVVRKLNACADFAAIKGSFRLLSMYYEWMLKDLALEEELSAGDVHVRTMGNLVLAQDEFETLLLRIANAKTLLFDVMADQELLKKRLVFLNAILEENLRRF